jgi:glycosyltransferase involved in cell wall biosynthesis
MGKKKFKKIKSILHITGMASTKYGGLESYFVELVRLCNKKGYNSILQYNSLPTSSEYAINLRNLGADVVTFNVNESSLRSILRLATLIYSIRPKIILAHFVNYKIRFAVPILGRLLGVQKNFAMVHSMHAPKKLSTRRFVFNNYSRIFAVSNAVRDCLIQAGVKPKIISTHYLGLFGNRIKSQKQHCKLREDFGIPMNSIVMACIAFDTPFKGLDILLKALANVYRKHPEIHLIIIGVDPAKSALPGQVAELGLDNCVHWAGVRDKGWKILNAADLYIQPSRFGEGLSIAILEAMALKLPVIATRVAGQVEAVIDGENGYLAEPGDVNSLTDTIEHLLAEKDNWKKLGDAGYLRYLRFFRGENSIETLVEKHFEL